MAKLQPKRSIFHGLPAPGMLSTIDAYLSSVLLMIIKIGIRLEQVRATFQDWSAKMLEIQPYQP